MDRGVETLWCAAGSARPARPRHTLTLPKVWIEHTGMAEGRAVFALSGLPAA
ncbi:hypothetical protein [Streptomyces blattellae]|uniref:hypothetical protein n=1 Tax=Streptomyces blattellae TaxID=2569855 RepID=UPI0012B6BD00|nr:hypothetical protein [Streptomyces blattellae]